MKTRLLVITTLILACLPVFANWGGDAGGSVATGAFKPFGTTQVEMQKEDLTIDLYRDRARIHVEYVLKNTGDAIDLKAGFPCLAAKSRKKNYVEIEDYHLTANGNEVAYQIEPGTLGNWKTLFTKDFLENLSGDEEEPMPANPPECYECRIWWLTSKVHFDKGETKQIKIDYESLYEYSEGGPSDDTYYNNSYFRYLLSTASVWKGPIQEGRITIRARTVDPGSIVIKPANRFENTKAGSVWVFKNLNPTLADNIEVSLNDKFYTLFNYSSLESEDHKDSTWYSFEGDRYYFDFHGYTPSASSQKPGYSVDNVADFSKDTAWAAGKDGGIDESVTLTLAKPTHVDQIGIIPGYAKSKQLYFANNRVQRLEVLVNGGHPMLVTLPDEYISQGPYSKRAYEIIDLPPYPGDAKTIRLTVKDVYRGARYNDTCISEILLRKRLVEKPDVHGAR